MPTKTPKTDFWISGLRQQLKLTAGVGSAYRISQQSGKCKLDIQYSDKSRKTAITPIEWKQENARLIEDSVIKIAQFIAAGKTLKEAVTRTFGTNSEAPQPTDDASIVDLVLSYDAYGEAKIDDGLIKIDNWNIYRY